MTSILGEIWWRAKFAVFYEEFGWWLEQVMFIYIVQNHMHYVSGHERLITAVFPDPSKDLWEEKKKEKKNLST